MRTRSTFLAVMLGFVATVAIADQYGPGKGGVASSLVCLLAGGADCTMTGTVVLNTAGGTNAALSETGIDRSSASAETFTITNSGAGATTTTLDALSVTDGTTQGGTVTHNAVATDVACGAGETWTNSCTNATFSTGTVTVPTLATTASEFMIAASYPNAALSLTAYGGFKSPQALTVKRLNILATGAGGTGSSVWTFSDGTNTCTCTAACPYSLTSTFAVTCSNGAGTGCSYAANTGVLLSFSTNCTSGSPTVRAISGWAIYN